MSRHLLSLSEQEFQGWLADRGQPKFRQAQIRKWLFEHRAESWEEMTDLPKALRSQLSEKFHLWSGSVVRHQKSDDGTEKLLVEFDAKARIECVLLRDEVRRTICISTQVGCGMGCVFCASGLDGVERNLTEGEILEQILRLVRQLDVDERLSHIVVMGMGEPLANVDALLPVLSQASRPDGLGISPRRITISTVGLPAAMRKLIEHDRHYRLAVSLHAPNDALRSRLVPVNDKIGLEAILNEADRYFEVSGRRLTFEYVLLAGLNDRPEHARELAGLLESREALLNVIPYNPVAGLPYRTPSGGAQRAFREVLEQRGVRVKFRHRKGDAIDAACGQLRRNNEPAVVDLESQ